jgi:hypothetical protein
MWCFLEPTQPVTLGIIGKLFHQALVGNDDKSPRLIIGATGNPYRVIYERFNPFPEYGLIAEIPATPATHYDIF